MKYINLFNTHVSYEEKLNGGGVDFKIPNVSYCKDANDVHFNPYNLIEFYVGDITGTPQTVKIYTDSSTSVDVTVSEGNKWYSYVLPKDKGLCKIKGDSVKKVVIKANISYEPIYRPPYYQYSIIPTSTVEASFKGSNTSNVTDMESMFRGCSGLTSLDVSSFNTNMVTDMSYMFKGCTSLTSLTLSNFNTSNVTYMDSMFYGCTNLKTIRMAGCKQPTIDKIKERLTKDNITGVTITT